MSRRKRIIIILCVCLVAINFAVFGIKRWVTVKLPEQFGVSRVYVTLDPDTIFLKIRTVVPDNDFAEWLLDSLRYSVAFDTVEFSSGIKKFGSEAADTVIDLPLKIDKTILFSTIEKLQVKDSTSLNIKLEPYVAMPGKGNKKIPFTINQRIKVPIPPEVTLDDIDLGKLKVDELSLNTRLQIVNLNPWEFIIHGGEITLDFPTMFDGMVAIAEPVHLKAKDTTFIETTVQLKEMKAARTAWNFIFKKDQVEYSLDGKLYISTVEEPYDTIDIILKSPRNKFSQNRGI